MRPFTIGAVVTLVATGCARSPTPEPVRPSLSPSAHGAGVNPANIRRIGRELPPDYEVTNGIPSAASPRLIWGLAADATTKPSQCATLADPGRGHDQSAQGVSGSGAGGIVDAVVVALPGPVAVGRDLLTACGQWTMTAGRAAASVRLTDAPRIDGVDTLGMTADVRTSVESGAETNSRTYTFTAYLGNYYAFTTLTTDPGSALPALAPQFAADLLVKTVSTLRS
ncbi:DUF5642 family protein [Mycobacterium haemophilum]|uniref:DUF5642 domain-containing protein n=1 Tax=Mycobacterium haemophilum TaxID=29311 RepID=A0A0I9YXD4_9MYCO|nr:hypothetical protein ABH39_06910 [Mycobacterium haemophilum]KLO38734.1 hypothetical protein ABH38_04485 [Mycobacterium haemophilum]KLO45052.1 hypothetical protein ABH37_03380 [Mycobacterium haemophilum]KLO56394.1 hypothetical protein ABH36_03360 [Mycobacterium haemophilum]